MTEKDGCLLIFDEVMTGFRVAYGGAQALYGITPDLTALGKVVGGGLPAAAYGASAAIMDHVSPVGPIYQAGTLSGNPLAMAAGLATLHCSVTSRPTSGSRRFPRAWPKGSTALPPTPECLMSSSGSAAC